MCDEKLLAQHCSFAAEQQATQHVVDALRGQTVARPFGLAKTN